MEQLLNVENDWDSDLDCPEVMGPCYLISEEEVAAAIKGLNIGKAAGHTGVVSEMMKASGGFGTSGMTDLINNIVKEGCIPDYWRKSISWCMCTRGKVIYLYVVHTELLSYWSSR